MKYNTHYDAIPPQFLQGTVLDVGCGDFSNQTKSKYSGHILGMLATLDYVGIDIEQDLFKWETDTLFDTVLAIHVVEHIDISKWPLMFKRLTSWVKKGGYLIIGTPHNQSSLVYKKYKGPENQRHVVFGITDKLIAQYIGTIQSFTYRGPYSQSLMCIWRRHY